MSTYKKIIWSISALLLLALLLTLDTIDPQNTGEKAPARAVSYGEGAKPGAKVETIVDGKTCGFTTANSEGRWKVSLICDSPSSTNQFSETSEKDVPTFAGIVVSLTLLVAGTITSIRIYRSLRTHDK